MQKDCGRYEKKIHVNRVKFEITDPETCIFDHSKEPQEKFTTVICSIGNLTKTSEETHTYNHIFIDHWDLLCFRPLSTDIKVNNNK